MEIPLQNVLYFYTSKTHSGCQLLSRTERESEAKTALCERILE